MEYGNKQLVNDKNKHPEDILTLIHDGDALIVPLGNGAPHVLVEALEKNANRFQNVRIHQMHAVKERNYNRKKESTPNPCILFFK